MLCRSEFQFVGNLMTVMVTMRFHSGLDFVRFTIGGTQTKDAQIYKISLYWATLEAKILFDVLIFHMATIYSLVKGILKGKT